MTFQRENRRPRRKHSISTRASTNSRIKIVPFSTCVYACVCAATNKNEIPLRHNTRSRILSFWPVKTLDPDYLAPNQFGKLGWVACMLVFASNFVFTWVITPVACVCACACDAKTRLKGYRMVPFNLKVLAKFGFRNCSQKIDGCSLAGAHGKI